MCYNVGKKEDIIKGDFANEKLSPHWDLNTQPSDSVGLHHSHTFLLCVGVHGLVASTLWDLEITVYRRIEKNLSNGRMLKQGRPCCLFKMQKMQKKCRVASQSVNETLRAVAKIFQTKLMM